MALPFDQDIEACFRAVATPGTDHTGQALDPALYAKYLEDAGVLAGTLRRQIEDGSDPVFRVLGGDVGCQNWRQQAAHIRDNFESVVLFGTGGSSLAARVLTALAPAASKSTRKFPQIAVQDNLDPRSFNLLLAERDLATTHFLVVSKSGATAETVMQALTAVQLLRRQGLAPARHMTILTMRGANPLGRLAAHYEIARIDHDPDLPGRCSVFSAVGLVPGMILGLDIDALVEGAALVLDQFQTERRAAEIPAVAGAAVARAFFETRTGGMTVLWPYLDQLEDLARWHRQLWAESLGKQGKGMTPVVALGPVDQHSQMQLFLDGPDDKYFTLLGLRTHEETPIIELDGDLRTIFESYQGKQIKHLVEAHFEGTVRSIKRAGRPVRRIEFTRLDERTLGALLMHFMLETVLTAGLLGVNPYDQPAVEYGKELARKYLAGKGAT